MKRLARAALRGFTDPFRDATKLFFAPLRDAWPLTFLSAAFAIGLTLKACGAMS